MGFKYQLEMCFQIEPGKIGCRHYSKEVEYPNPLHKGDKIKMQIYTLAINDIVHSPNTSRVKLDTDKDTFLKTSNERLEEILLEEGFKLKK